MLNSVLATCWEKKITTIKKTSKYYAQRHSASSKLNVDQHSTAIKPIYLMNQISLEFKFSYGEKNDR